MTEAPHPIKKHYDVSGADGLRGTDGPDARPRRGASGQQGHKGGAGTEGTEGQTAGGLRLRLFDPAGYGRTTREILGVAGKLVKADGSPEEVDDRLRVTQDTEVFGDAHGGDGGDGGNGGRGARGARGTSGSNATRYSAAGDGGRGGRGGMGGAAANGKSPGAGGHVILVVDYRDTDLAVKARYNVQPGRVGKAGTPGPGGQGGPGGPGGNGTFWIEIYTTTENGKTVTKTRHHSRPAGSRGPSGGSGPTNDEPVYDGVEQPTGTFTIVVTDAEGRPLNEYHEVYDLELLEFETRSRNVDGVFEPGEEVLVTNLRLRNRTGKDRMPTPPGFRIKIYFKQHGFLDGDGGELEMTESLQAGGERSIAGPLVVKLRDISDAEIPQVGEAWNAHQVVNPCAELESVRHEFDNFEAAQTIHLRFPIEVTPMSSANSMARGDRKKIFWKVRNVSSRDFGSRSELLRGVATLIRRDGGSLAEEHFAFYTPDGSRVHLDAAGFIERIEHLAPYDGTPETEALIEGDVEIGDKAPFYEEAELRLELSLGRIGDPTKLRRIQGRAHTVRVAQSYRKTPDSDLLLVTNSNSSRPEVEAWRELAESFGMELDIWDLSYNKGFDLADERSSRERLAHDFRGKTVIFLNNEFKVTVGDNADTHSVVADAYIDSTAFLKAVADKAVSFLFVGTAALGGAHVLRELMRPVKAQEQRGKESSWHSPAHFLRDLRAQAYEADDGSGLRDETGYVDTAAYVTVRKRWYCFGFKPKAKHLDSIARETLAHADRLFPTRRYRVTPRYRPEPGKRLWWTGWMFKEYDLGEIELTRSLDRTVRETSGTLTALDAGDEMHTRDFVLSRAVVTSFLQSLKPKQKLEVFAHLFGHHSRGLSAPQRREAGEALVDAVLADLAVEQAAMRGHWGGGFSKRRLRAGMENLRSLAEEHDFGLSARPGSEKADLLVRLIAGIEHLGRSQRLWRDTFYRTVGWLLPLAAAGVAVFFGIQHFAQSEIYLLQQAPEAMQDSVTLPGLPYAFDPEIYYFLPALLAPILSLLSLVFMTRRNGQVSSLTASWARHLNQRLFPQNDDDRGDYRDTWAQVKGEVKRLRDAVTARLEANQAARWKLPRPDRRHESLRQMQWPVAAVTTDNELNLDLEERFLSAEDLDSARAESARRAAAKEILEADMKIADQTLTATHDGPRRRSRVSVLTPTAFG